MLVASPQSALYRSKPKAIDPSASEQITRIMGELSRATKLVERYRKDARNAAKKLHAEETELKTANRRIAELERSLTAVKGSG